MKLTVLQKHIICTLIYKKIINSIYDSIFQNFKISLEFLYGIFHFRHNLFFRHLFFGFYFWGHFEPIGFFLQCVRIKCIQGLK